MMENSKHVPFFNWGANHLSLLLYVECRCVDNGGELDPFDLNEFRYLIKLRDGSVETGHTDRDCLYDFEKSELLTNKGTNQDPVIVLTDLGWALCAALRKHRGQGNPLNEFDIEDWFYKNANASWKQ